jgi:hypothetical protein
LERFGARSVPAGGAHEVVGEMRVDDRAAVRVFLTTVQDWVDGYDVEGASVAFGSRRFPLRPRRLAWIDL